MSERKIVFDEISDKTAHSVIHPETEETMAEITGYGLDVKFNMELINSQEDIDGVASGIADIFKELLINKLLSKG